MPSSPYAGRRVGEASKPGPATEEQWANCLRALAQMGRLRQQPGPPRRGVHARHELNGRAAAAADANEDRRAPCLVFARGELCRYGQQCAFSHANPGPRGAPAPSAAAPASASGSAPNEGRGAAGLTLRPEAVAWLRSLPATRGEHGGESRRGAGSNDGSGGRCPPTAAHGGTGANAHPVSLRPEAAAWLARLPRAPPTGAQAAEFPPPRAPAGRGRGATQPAWRRDPPGPAGGTAAPSTPRGGAAAAVVPPTSGSGLDEQSNSTSSSSSSSSSSSMLVMIVCRWCAPVPPPMLSAVPDPPTPGTNSSSAQQRHRPSDRPRSLHPTRPFLLGRLHHNCDPNSQEMMVWAPYRPAAGGALASSVSSAPRLHTHRGPQPSA